MRIIIQFADLSSKHFSYLVTVKYRAKQKQLHHDLLKTTMDNSVFF